MNNIFQTKDWEEVKLATGYQKSYWVSDILVLVKELPLGRSMLYSPMVDESQESGVRSQEFWKKISEIGKENNSIFYRIEFDIEKNSSTLPTSNSKLIKAFEEMQPEHTLILDLTKDKEEILAQMKQKGRYNIKIAAKNGVLVTCDEIGSESAATFYSLYQMMGKRHKITSRNQKYFSTLLEILHQKGYARVYTAWIEAENKRIPLSSAIILHYNGRATYLYGGSDNEHKSFMAPYLLHWQAICDAKEAGLKEYDFFGIAPNEDPKHPWSGVTRFKKQFGGAEVATLGSYDLPFNKIEYQIFKIMEKIRR